MSLEKSWRTNQRILQERRQQLEQEPLQILEIQQRSTMLHLHRKGNVVRLHTRLFFICILGLLMPFCRAQNTGSATAKGTCIVANTGSNARIYQNCTEVDPELFREFNAMARATKSNANLLGALLVQLKTLRKELAQTPLLRGPNGFVIGGSIVNNPTINNTFAASHPAPGIDWTQTPEPTSKTPMSGALEKNPGMRVTITLKSVFYNPVFVFQCDRPCQATDAATFGICSVQMLSAPRNPNVTGAAFAMPSQLFFGAQVSVKIRSQDSQPITIVAAQPYIPSE